MSMSNSCLAEAYCQDDYSDDYHDVIAEGYCRAMETFESAKGNFETWVGIQRTWAVRKEQRLRRKVGYLEEVCAANEKDDESVYLENTSDVGFEGLENPSDESMHLENASNVSFESPENSNDSFLLSPESIFNAVLKKEREKIIEDLLSSVGKRSRIVIIKRFYEEQTMNEIAKELKITDSTVQRDQKKTLRSFREMLRKKNVVYYDLIRLQARKNKRNSKCAQGAVI